MASEDQNEKQWIRGVNLGGWLVLENYITPYFFAITDCHTKGDFRFFKDQIDAPPTSSPVYKPMDEAARKECSPLPKYPYDEWTFASAFEDKEVLKKYLDIHYENFLTRDNIAKIKASGATHVRVPLGHWITGNIADDEPYVEGGWKYFKRLVEWCREEGLQIWPDLHTAPGSQNGFDNSGRLGTEKCTGWDNGGNLTDGWQLPTNVARTLEILNDISSKMKDDKMLDVVTGFGMLNEPAYCDKHTLEIFYNLGLKILRRNMGKDIGIYIGDEFRPDLWNDFWALEEYKGTYLDSHTYHPFEPHARHLSPRQQIALVCQRDHKAVVSCCYHNGEASKGIGRIFGEWSASFDHSVGEQVNWIMDSIRYTGAAYKLNETTPANRQAFLRNFVEAQMVNYESVQSSGWFYWNFKMEGSVFSEWDFLRGIDEGWFPKIPAPDVNSVDLYGSCYDIMFKTDDDMTVVDEIPGPPPDLATSFNPISDDVVLSDGANLHKSADGTWIIGPETTTTVTTVETVIEVQTDVREDRSGMLVGSFVILIACLCYFLTKAKNKSVEGSYTKVDDAKSAPIRQKESTGHTLNVESPYSSFDGSTAA